jgi:putative membrane protein
MNITTNYKNHLKNSFIIIAFSIGILSCKDSKKEDDPIAVAEDHNEAKFHDSNKKDAELMVDLVEISLREQALAKKAQMQGMEKEIKEMGKEVEESQSKRLEELKKLAKSKSITVPDSISTSEINDNKSPVNKKENNFDKSFCEEMADEHRKAIKKCEKASTDSEDIDIRNWTIKALPELRTQLDKFMTCEAKYK